MAEHAPTTAAPKQSGKLGLVHALIAGIIVAAFVMIFFVSRDGSAPAQAGSSSPTVAESPSSASSTAVSARLEQSDAQSCPSDGRMLTTLQPGEQVVIVGPSKVRVQYYPDPREEGSPVSVCSQWGNVCITPATPEITGNLSRMVIKNTSDKPVPVSCTY